MPQIIFGCSLLLMAGLIFSPFLISVSMWLLAACALWQAHCTLKTTNPDSTWFQAVLFSLRNFIRQPVYTGFLMLLLVTVFSGLWSADLGYWGVRTRVRIPLFILPWTFANLPALSLRLRHALLYCLVWILVLTCIGIGINFLWNFKEIIFDLSEGRPMPVPRSGHIRFSLIAVTGILSGGYLWVEQFYWRYRWERWALGGAVVFLFVFLHILSARSGLVALYVSLAFTVARFLWRTRRWGLGLTALLTLMLMPLIAVKTIPSLRERMAYMLWDWQQYANNTGENYSDSARFVSLEIGLRMFAENPWIGVGAGDLPAETARLTQAYFPNYNLDPKLPHNQLIYIMATTGLFGLIISLWGMLYPVFQDRYRRFYLFAAFQVVIFVSFLVEYTLETSIGLCFYLFYTLWFIKMAEEN